MKWRRGPRRSRTGCIFRPGQPAPTTSPNRAHASWKGKAVQAMVSHDAMELHCVQHGKQHSAAHKGRRCRPGKRRERTDRRVVRDLLAKEMRSIGKLGLKSLSQNRVKRFGLPHGHGKSKECGSNVWAREKKKRIWSSHPPTDNQGKSRVSNPFQPGCSRREGRK